MHRFVKISLAFILIFSRCNNLEAQLFALDKNIHLKANIHFVVLDAEEYKNGKPNKNSDKIGLIYEFDKKKNIIKLNMYKDSKLINAFEMEYDTVGNVRKETITEYDEEYTRKDSLSHKYIYHNNRKAIEYTPDSIRIILYEYNINGAYQAVKYRYNVKPDTSNIIFDRIFGGSEYYINAFYLFGMPVDEDQLQFFTYDSLNRLNRKEIYEADPTFTDCKLRNCSLYYYDSRNRLSGIKITSESPDRFTDYEYSILNRINSETTSHKQFSIDTESEYIKIESIKVYKYTILGVLKQMNLLRYTKDGASEIDYIYHYKFSYY
jgi:hypothetical protein